MNYSNTYLIHLPWASLRLQAEVHDGTGGDDLRHRVLLPPNVDLYLLNPYVLYGLIYWRVLPSPVWPALWEFFSRDLTFNQVI